MVKNSNIPLNTENDSMRFNAYEAEDFLQEQSFLNYCVAANDQDVLFWNNWVKEHPERQTAIEQAKSLYYMLNGNITAKEFAASEKSFIDAFDKHAGTVSPVVQKGRVIKTWWRAAAAAACVIIVFLIYNNSNFKAKEATAAKQTAYSMPNASFEKKPLVLPDGSSVTLNSGSVIRLSDDFNSTSRELTLEGEAYFNVTHNAEKPFIIHTSTMDVKVLGTEFNVKAYPSDRESETSLISGSVEVTLQKSKQKIVLKPNHKVTLVNGDEVPLSGKSTPVQVRPLTTTGGGQAAELWWTKNKLVLRDNDFEHIARELERWYNVRLLFEDEAVKKFRYSGTFENKNADEVLAALRLSRPFQIRKEDSNIIRISSHE